MKDEKFEEETFPKASLLNIRWAGWYFFLKIYYSRFANAGCLYVIGFCIVWRLPWHPRAAFHKGWDACWRQLNEAGQLKDQS